MDEYNETCPQCDLPAQRCPNGDDCPDSCNYCHGVGWMHPPDGISVVAATPRDFGEVFIHKGHWWGHENRVMIPTGYEVLSIQRLRNCSLELRGPLKAEPLATLPLRLGDYIKVIPDTKWVGWSFMLDVERKN